MISLIHLIWIVPVSATIGLVTAVMCLEAGMNSRAEEQEAKWENDST